MLLSAPQILIFFFSSSIFFNIFSSDYFFEVNFFFFRCHIGGKIVLRWEEKRKKLRRFRRESFFCDEAQGALRWSWSWPRCTYCTYRKRKRMKADPLLILREGDGDKHAEHKHGAGILFRLTPYLSLSTSKQSFHSHIQLTSLGFHSRSKVFRHTMITENLFWPTV